MKYLPFFAILALTASCKEDSIDAQYTIEEGQSKSVSADNKSTLTVSSIQNNLCPPNVVCIRAGEVLVDLIASQDGNTATINLCKGPDCQTLQNGKPIKTTVTVGGRVWTVELVDALTTTPEKAVVSVQIQ